MATVRGGERQTAYLANLRKKLGNGVTKVNVGFLAGSRHPSLYGGQSLPTALIAAIHQFGAPAAGIPARPFMSITVANYKGGWAATMAATLKATGYNVERTLGLMGDQIKGQMQQTITELWEPALSAVTLRIRRTRKVMRTNSTKPLVDTGFMLNSVDYEVTDK